MFELVLVVGHPTYWSTWPMPSVKCRWLDQIMTTSGKIKWPQWLTR